MVNLFFVDFFIQVVILVHFYANNFRTMSIIGRETDTRDEECFLLLRIKSHCITLK